MFAGVLAIGSLAMSLLLRIPFTALLALPCTADRNPPDESAPRWLLRSGWAVAAFGMISACRLVVLNNFSTPVAKSRWDLTEADRTSVLQRFAALDPAWRRIADPALTVAARGWERPVFVEPGWIEPEIYRFPAGGGVDHWSGLFAARPYTHTSFMFRGPGRSFAARVWVDFAGDIPSELGAGPCVLIGFAKVRPRVTAYFENSVEAVAIIPSPGSKPDFARAIIAPAVPETQALLDAVTKPAQ